MAESARPSPKKATKNPSAAKTKSSASTTSEPYVEMKNSTIAGFELIKVLKRDVERLKQVYYNEGYTLGRDALHGILKGKYKDPPSKRAIMAWLKHQKLHQLYAQAKNTDTVQSFTPVTPIHSLSADLIDFTNKPAQQFRYILVVVDNFSRYMFAKAITSKTHGTVAKAMGEILDEVKEEFNKKPQFVLSDDGGEFKGDYIKLLESRGIKKKRTLAGAPQSNGMVERANGKLKMLLSQNKEIFKGTWKSNLNKGIRIYNEYKNRTIGYSPKAAVNLKTKNEIYDLVSNVKKTQLVENRPQVVDYKVGDRVRIKVPKGKLDKMSTPNWSDKIHKIKEVVRKDAMIASKYIIEGLAEDKRYARADLQIIYGKVEDIPQIKKPKKDREELDIQTDDEDDDATPKIRRSSRTAVAPSTAAPRTLRSRDKKDTKAKNDDDDYEIEKLLDYDKKEDLVKIRWKGYSSKFDTWEPVQSVQRLQIWKDFINSRKKKK